MNRPLWIGTYPGDADAPEGVWRADDADSPRGLGLVAPSPSASFLAIHPSAPVLYAVDEREAGRVRSFRMTQDGGLEPLGTYDSGGAEPCHLVATDRHLLVSNYGSGSLGVLPLASDGSVRGATQRFDHTGGGPHERQDAPHTHSALVLPGGCHAWVADLGSDEILRYRLDADGVVSDGVAVRLPAGTGPRHMVWHGSGVVLVVGELDARVHVVQVDLANGSGRAGGSVAACAQPPSSEPLPSHVALSADGDRVYVAVRGPDVLAVFAIEAAAGRDEPAPVRLRHLTDVATGGVWPRHFALAGTWGAHVPDGDRAGERSAGDACERAPGDRLVVAHQTSCDLVVLDVDAHGHGAVRDHVPVPVPPACVLPG